MLGEEATVLRIDALLRSGHRSTARALAEEFMTARPKSPYRSRVRAMADAVEAR
jgi:hypothetical protein